MKKYGSNLILNLGEGIVVYDLDFLSTITNFDVIMTAGDNILPVEKRIKIPQDSRLMIRVKHLWNADFAVNFQSKFFLEQLPWCVVYDTSDNPSDFKEEILRLFEEVPNYAVDLGTNGDLERVDKFFEIYNCYPQYIFSPINPLKYRKDIIDYCNEHEIELIATEIYGNKESEEWMKETFTTDYLERFAGINSSGFEINISSLPVVDYLDSITSFGKLKGTEDDDEIFTMSMDIWKDKVSPAKRKVHAYREVDGSKFAWLPSRNSGKVGLSFKKDLSLSENHKKIMKVLDDFKFPEGFLDVDKKKYSDMLCISTIATNNPYYRIKYTIRGDVTVITLIHRYFPWMKKKLFICSYTDEYPYIIEYNDKKA